MEVDIARQAAFVEIAFGAQNLVARLTDVVERFEHVRAKVWSLQLRIVKCVTTDRPSRKRTRCWLDLDFNIP
jgi:hypothetical protein